MIYSTNLNIIFIKTKKVGGSSFEVALSKFCKPNDILTGDASKKIAKNNWQTRVNYKHNDRCIELIEKGVVGDFFDHMSSELIRANLGETLFNNATKISIQRDPLDFLISMFFFKKNHKRKFIKPETTFKEWLTDNYFTFTENYEISPLKGPLSPDITIRYEKIEDDIRSINKLPNEFLSTFQSMKCKSRSRPSYTKDVKSFFFEEDCEDFIPKIYKLDSEFRS